MIVSHERKFIFLAIPKSGSGSVQDYLQNFGQRSLGIAHENHKTANQVIEHVGIQKWNGYMKIAFSRNPWDRYVSLYIWIKRFRTNRGWDVGFDTFAEYINTGCEEGMHQRDFFFDSNGKMIVDYIGRFEYLLEDVQDLARLLGEPEPQAISFNNQNNNIGRKHYTKYFTEQWMIDTVAEREKLIIDFMGYEYGEDGERWRNENSYNHTIL